MNEPNSSAFGQSSFSQSAFGGNEQVQTPSRSSGWYEAFRSYESEPGLESPGFVDYVKQIAGGEFDKATEDPLSYVGDVAAAVPRGVVDAGMGIYGAADWLTADLLPDWETNPLGTSETIAGSLVQGVSNFLVGFIPVAGWLGKANQISKLGRAGQFIASKSRGASLARNTLASVVADATVFRGDQERLSNLLTQVDNPLFNNAVTQYLAADGDDGELEGRFKNAVEGLGLGLITDGLIAGLKAIKKSKAKIEAGGTVEEALSERDKALAGARLLELAGVVNDAGKEVAEVVDSASTGPAPKDPTTINDLAKAPEWNASREAVGGPNKLVDSGGKLVPMFHGTPSGGFSEFDPSKLGSGAGHSHGGFSFTSRLASAESYAKMLDEKRRAIRDMVQKVNRVWLKAKHTPTLAKRGIWEDPDDVIEWDWTLPESVDEVREAILDAADAFAKDGVEDTATELRQIAELGSVGGTREVIAAHLYVPNNARELEATPETLGDVLAGVDVRNEPGRAVIVNMPGGERVVIIADAENIRPFRRLSASPSIFDSGSPRRTSAGPESSASSAATPKTSADAASAADSATPTERYVAEGRQNNPDARAEKAQLDPKERINWYQATPAQMQSVRKLVEAIDNGTLSQANITIEEAVEKLGISKSWFGNRYLKDGIPDPSESRDAALVLAEAMNNAYGDAKPPKPTTWKETLGGSLYEMKTMMGMSDVEAIAILEKLRERQIDIRHWLTSAKHIEYMRANTIAKKAKEFKARFERAQELEKAGDPIMAAEARREATKLAKGLFLNGIGIERLARANAALSSEVGRTLNILRMTPEQAKKRLGEISADYMSRGILTKRLDAMKPEEMMEELSRLHLLGEFGPKALQEYANAYKGAGNFWKMPYEVWVNGVLSGLKTFVVNMNGLAMAVARPMEMSLGKLLTGQPKEAKEAIRLAFTWTSKYSEALTFARKAWKEERPILANEMFIDDWAGGVIRSDMDNPLGASINVFGRLIRTPTRVMLFTDEFIKQATARAKVDEMLRAKALKLVELGALDSSDMDRWVADEVSRMMYDNGRIYSEKAVRDAAIISARERGYQPNEDAFKNHVRLYVERHFDPSRGRIADEARKYAAEITWQTDLDGQGVLESVGGTIQTLTRKVPFFKLIFPFVRTPTNLMVWLKDRSLFGSMKMYKDFTSGDPTRKADAVGRLSVASGLWITAAIAAGNGVITGRGPKDPRQKKILQDAGWQPYSIKTSEGYISYHRMEPFSFIFGIIADLHDTLNNVYEDPAIEQTYEKIIGATLSALSNSVSEKTYFTGLDMWFDAFTSGQPQKFARLFRNYAASTVPNFAASFVPLVDDEVKEARTALDAMMAKIPGMSDEVEPYRNILGEPITKARSWGPYGVLDPANPFTWSADTKDPVKTELAKLGYGFSPPAHTKDGVDLRELRSKTGQSAYDRLQELTGQVSIGGQSLHQSLKKLMSSEAYRRMNDQSFEEIDSPRVQEVKRVVARYRKQAQAQLLREFPEINQAFQLSRENQYRMKIGLSPQ